MKSNSTIAQVEKTVTDLLAECQNLITKFPENINLGIVVTETATAFRVDFTYLKGGTYWFTWLKKEKDAKLVAYIYDTYNYIINNAT